MRVRRAPTVRSWLSGVVLFAAVLGLCRLSERAVRADDPPKYPGPDPTKPWDCLNNNCNDCKASIELISGQVVPTGTCDKTTSVLDRLTGVNPCAGSKCACRLGIQGVVDENGRFTGTYPGYCYTDAVNPNPVLPPETVEPPLAPPKK